MKKLYCLLLTCLLSLFCVVENCAHIHTDYCGEKGANCNHHHIQLFDDEIYGY